MHLKSSHGASQIVHNPPSCFETICLLDGVVHNVEYHNHRLNQTRKELYGSTAAIDILHHLPTLPTTGLHKIRVVYLDSITDISIEPYTPRDITEFICVATDMDYSCKYTNRDEINHLLKDLKPNQEIIMIIDNLITDTSIANIAIYIDSTWLTPATPLLAGTTRAKLIEDSQLKTADLKIDDLRNATSVALMNAMIGFQQINIKGSICQCR